MQVSDDAENWRDIQALPGGTSLVDDIKLGRCPEGIMLEFTLPDSSKALPLTTALLSLLIKRSLAILYSM